MKRTVHALDVLALMLLLMVCAVLAGYWQSGGNGIGIDSAIAAPKPPTDLSGVTQNWDKNLPSSSRFTVLAAFNNQAVRDDNTGLVWEQAPDATSLPWGAGPTNGATGTCANKNVGGQKGWRLPSVAELASLIDPTVASPGPTLPAGHPFTNVQGSTYWTATTWATDTGQAWTVDFSDGIVFPGSKLLGLNRMWCVRGGMNADVY